MSALFQEALDHKKSCFDIDWKADGTKEEHMNTLHSFSFILFHFQCQHILVFLYVWDLEYSIAMPKALDCAYYEFNIIITFTNKSMSLQLQNENVFQDVNI